MNRVLFVAYHFPPLGGAGVQRTLKFVRYLPELGWEPIVVTTPGDPSDEWTPLDTTLGEELDRSTVVDRVPGPIPGGGSRVRQRLERLAWLPSEWRRWWVDGVVAAGARHRDVDLVYASMGPYESGEAAARLAARLGLPWVADLRDPWALDEMLEYPTGLHRRAARERMRRVLEDATAVVMNTPEAADAVRAAFPRLRNTPIAVIPNGYDASDFASPAPSRESDVFRIVHTGSMHTAAGRLRRSTPWLRKRLGGLAPVDPLTRSHHFLMDGLGRLVQSRPELGDVLEVHLAGAMSDADRAVPGHGLVREHGYLTHNESVALVRSADLLFLPMQDLPLGHRARIVPGKTYEYLGSGRPLLGAVPDGDARDLLARVPWACLCRPSDGDAMARIVADLATRKRSAGAEPDGDLRLIEHFERRGLTRALAALFDEAAGGVPRTAVLAA
jgi:glycosyltransferase involved in cell wall biosynthesis